MKKFNSKLTARNVKQREIIDMETGELLERYQTQDWVVKVNTDEFVFFYKKLFSVLKDISESDLRVFMAIMFRVDYSTAVIRLDKYIIDLICEDLGFKEGTVRNSISALSKKCILIKDNNFRGVYRVNPECSWKGNQSDRPKALRVLLLEEIKMAVSNEERNEYIADDISKIKPKED